MPPVASDTNPSAPKEQQDALATATTSITFQHQSSLPRLPIPELADTCKRYLSSLVCLQSPEEHATTSKVVSEFLEGDGPKLQQGLVDYAKDKASYIEEFWDESYLQASDSVVLNLNPFFILEDDPTPTRGNQLQRTADLILASLAFVHDLRTGVLRPDNVRGTPLDMMQYTRLFSTARIPTTSGCKLNITEESRHVVVMRRGQIYWFEALDEEHRPVFTERAMLGNLQAIVRDADKTQPHEVAQGAIGVLTTEKRPIWSAYRDHMMEDANNRRCLEVVDSALFVVCMDDSEPMDASELCNNMLCGTYRLQEGVQVGTCTNRWYDKLQIIVCANGAAGINFEHTGVDGHTVLRYVADIYTELIMRFAKSINSATQSLFKAKASPYAKGAGKRPTSSEADLQIVQRIEAETTPKKLEWTITPKLSAGIRHGEMRLSDLICQNECQVLEFADYGKNFITRHKFSPDAFVQMAFQAAYFTLYGRSETTYEPAMTKAFLHGRTEAIRTVQPHSQKFVETYLSDASSTEKLDALRKACEGHVKLSKACASGLGHDRHLYAMLAVWKKNQAEKGLKDAVPALFQDPGYATLNHTVISTSNCGNPALRMFGFGPVAPDGFGIGYIIKDDGITVCASSKHLQTRRYLDTLQTYLRKTQGMIIETYKAANVRAKDTYIDHAGVECDVRTGLPIGSNKKGSNGYTDDWDEYQRQGVGESGYSFWGDSTASKTEETNSLLGSPRSRREGVGRKIIFNEYS